MDAASRMEAHDRPIGRAIFIPAATMSRPHSTLHERGNVLVEVTNSFATGRECFDTLSLHLLEHVDHVLGCVFGDGQHRAVADGGIWP